MHIAFLTPEFPHPELKRSGGLGTSIYNLAVALYKKGVRVSIFVPFQKNSRTIESEGIIIYAIEQKRYSLMNWFFYKKFVQSSINKICLKEKIDVVEGPDWTGIGTFINLKVPYTVRLNGSDTYFCHIEQRKQKYKNYWLEKKNFKKAKAILSASTYTGELTNTIFNTSRPITTIYNSIDVNTFKPSDEVEIVSNQILYFGTLIRKKGVLDLAYTINVLAEKLESFEVVFLGKDVIDYKEQKSTKQLILEILTVKAKSKVIFIEEVPYAQVKSYLERTQVICLPSYAEAFPMTWLESMALRKAMVTSNIGWAKEMMIDGETGYTVDPSDHVLMAERLIKLIENPELCIKMGEQARERVSAVFSTEIIADQNYTFYQKIINS